MVSCNGISPWQTFLMHLTYRANVGQLANVAPGAALDRFEELARVLSRGHRDDR